MHWKLRALAHLILSSVPFGERLNYVLQRHLTRSLPISDAQFAELADIGKAHADAFSRYGNRTLAEATFYEFGAGWDLVIPLSLYALGVSRQILVDIRPLVRAELVNDTIAKFHRVPLTLPLLRTPKQLIESNDRRGICTALHRYHGIDYFAPHDARRTGLPPASIDCITSTSTLEHIPPPDIRAILQECRRILRRGGVISMRINYDDHYAFVDRRISVYNFLRYSDRVWHDLFSPSLHYQNRLRHSDYLTLFREAGLEVLEARRIDGTAADLASLAQLPLDRRFRGYSIEDLAVRGAFVVLRPSLVKS